MKKIKFVVLAIVALVMSACAYTDMALDILDVMVLDAPAPTPVCDSESVGSNYNEEQCLKFSDGSYQWAK